MTPHLLISYKASSPGDALGQYWAVGVKGVISVGESKPCLKRAQVTSVAHFDSPDATLQPQGPPRNPYWNLIAFAAF